MYQKLLALLMIGASNLVLAEPVLLTGKIFPAVSLVSEHRYQGMSLTDRNPALQVSLHWWRPDDYYAGVWFSNVDYLDSNNTNLEFDIYVGREFRASNPSFKVELMHSAYNDDEPGPTYDFSQISTEAKWTAGAFTQHARASWSPEGSFGAGRTWQFRLVSQYQLSSSVSAEVVLGRQISESRAARRHGEFALKYKPGNISFELRYVNMHTDLVLCDFVDWCEPTVVGKITLATY